MSRPPTVMVSSTFYDLRHVRADLRHFIGDELGLTPLLSELPSFPVDPDLNTIENCRARVEKDADIMVLVIGGRYGSVDLDSDRSVTNLEFLAAREKGIPIYVFVEKSILALLPVWRANPTADFAAVADTPRLFEFIESVRTQDRVWTFPFETAADIVGTLRVQLAYLFFDSLQLRQRLSGATLPRYLESIGPRALRIALEKPRGWEHRLFFETWVDEVESRADLVKMYQDRLTLERAEWVPAANASEWLLTRLHELQGLVNSANHLVNVAVPEAFGAPGEPGDPERIIWVSQMLGLALDRMLNWGSHTRCARLGEPFDRMGERLASFVDELVTEFQRFPRASLTSLEEVLSLPQTDEPRQLELTIVFSLSNVAEYEAEMVRIERVFGL